MVFNGGYRNQTSKSYREVICAYLHTILYAYIRTHIFAELYNEIFFCVDLLLFFSFFHILVSLLMMIHSRYKIFVELFLSLKFLFQNKTHTHSVYLAELYQSKHKTLSIFIIIPLQHTVLYTTYCGIQTKYIY